MYGADCERQFSLRRLDAVLSEAEQGEHLAKEMLKVCVGVGGGVGGVGVGVGVERWVGWGAGRGGGGAAAGQGLGGGGTTACTTEDGGMPGMEGSG